MYICMGRFLRMILEKVAVTIRVFEKLLDIDSMGILQVSEWHTMAVLPSYYILITR